MGLAPLRAACRSVYRDFVDCVWTTPLLSGQQQHELKLYISADNWYQTKLLFMQMRFKNKDFAQQEYLSVIRRM